MLHRRAATALALAAGVMLAGACASHPPRPWEYEPRPMADTLAIHEPEAYEASLIYTQVYGFFQGLQRVSNVNRHLAGLPPALNADAFDEVVNSSWFTNRNAYEPLTPEEVERGPQSDVGLDQSGPVTVTSIKTIGVSKGFNVEDARGERYIVKLDPPDYPELASGAEMVATSLFWAAGYHTPENYVVYLDPENLVIEEGLEAKFPVGDSLITFVAEGQEGEHELTLDVFREHLLGEQPRYGDGTVRVMASKLLDGISKGPFSYQGTREDDPNDVIPHEHRRELRGLYPVAAWLNHVDTKSGNTLDMFIVDPSSPEGEDAPKIGHIRHHLIDFGSTLGSAATRPHDPRHGTEFEFDARALMLRLATLGIYERPWQDMDMTPDVPPSIGYYSIDNYFPGDWRPGILNPAFVNMQPRDAYWGAKLVMSFTDEQLEAAVRAGRYTDPAAEAYLLENLEKRRDATGRHWFRQVSPLDRPRVEDGAVVFDDLWARHFGGSTVYEWELEWDAPDPDVEGEGTAREPRIALPAPTRPVPDADPDDAHARLEVRKIFPDGEEAPRPATIWLAWEEASRSYRVVGVRY
ncbi:MAG: hypothetical protein R3199_06170 [Gemmatimonadota bacterium]|nr:hypothetical protein [Gemmatimonadota bacterium]